MSGIALWRARWRTWVPALLFFAANAGGLALYRFAYADRLEVLGQRVGRLQGRLQGLGERRSELEKRVNLAREDRRNIATLYQERFSTERERLTKTLAEFKTLATRAGMQPQSVSYPEEELAQFGLVKKSIVFGVDGDYNSLRQMMHLLELSPTFFSLEEVRLGDGGGGPSGGRLRIALKIATLFVNERATARALGAGAPLAEAGAKAPVPIPAAPPASAKDEAQ